MWKAHSLLPHSVYLFCPTSEPILWRIRVLLCVCVYIYIYILLAKQVVLFPIVNFHEIYVQASDARIVAKPATLQATCLQISHFASKERYLFSRSIWCVPLRPLEVLLPSATGWTTGVSSLLQPAGELRCQCGPAHWHGTLSKTIAYLTSQKPNIST